MAVTIWWPPELSFSSSRFRWSIVQVGAGGTGSLLFPHLCRLVAALGLGSNVRVTLCDGDEVEPKNFARQHFAPEDVGRNKAEVLAERYSCLVPDIWTAGYIEDPAQLLEYLIDGDIRVLIGCVDNHFSRRILHRVFEQVSSVIYIDAGNELYSGEVVTGLRRNGELVLLPKAALFPEVLDTDDYIKKGGTCGQSEDTQTIIANLAAATAVTQVLYGILARGVIESHVIYFNAQTGAQRVVPAVAAGKEEEA